MYKCIHVYKFINIYMWIYIGMCKFTNIYPHIHLHTDSAMAAVKRLSEGFEYLNQLSASR
jgi:hypothetical protein